MQLLARVGVLARVEDDEVMQGHGQMIPKLQIADCRLHPSMHWRRRGSRASPLAGRSQRRTAVLAARGRSSLGSPRAIGRGSACADAHSCGSVSSDRVATAPTARRGRCRGWSARRASAQFRQSAIWAICNHQFRMPPHTKSLRERFGALRNLPPFLKLVWQTSPRSPPRNLVAARWCARCCRWRRSTSAS